MAEKRCIECRKIKPIEQFYKNRNGNYQSYCKPCKGQRMLANYHKRRAERQVQQERTLESMGVSEEQRSSGSPLYMTTKQLLDRYGVMEDGVRKVPANTVQLLLQGIDPLSSSPTEDTNSSDEL